MISALADDSGENEEEQACGTTATVVLVRKDKVVVANIGDSRAVLSRHGKAVDLSKEHRCAALSYVTILRVRSS